MDESAHESATGATTGEAGAAQVAAQVRHAEPTPTVEEMAAIAAAVEMAWPRPQPVPHREPPLRWRFSGRWWSKPIPLRRDRPGGGF